jgi:hypothetical protein
LAYGHALPDSSLAEPCPRQNHTIVTDGFSTYDSEGDVLAEMYATAAATAYGSLAVIYVPTARTIRLERSPLTNGERRRASVPFTTPGKNSAGDEDWVLLVSACVSARRNRSVPFRSWQLEFHALSKRRMLI